MCHARCSCLGRRVEDVDDAASSKIAALRVRISFGGRRRLAAAVLLAAGCLLMLAVMTWLSVVVVREIRDGVALLQDTLRTGGLEGLLQKLPAHSPVLRADCSIGSRMPTTLGPGR
jgi:hypothetical protein